MREPLSVDLMPDISYPTLSISTEYENASPEEIEELISRPVEEAMSAVPGVEEVTSTSAEGKQQRPGEFFLRNGFRCRHCRCS